MRHCIFEASLQASGLGCGGCCYSSLFALLLLALLLSQRRYYLAHIKRTLCLGAQAAAPADPPPRLTAESLAALASTGHGSDAVSRCPQTCASHGSPG